MVESRHLRIVFCGDGFRGWWQDVFPECGRRKLRCFVLIELRQSMDETEMDSSITFFIKGYIVFLI